MIEPEHIFMSALKCREKSGATKEDIHSIAIREIPDSETGKCMLKCMEENSGIIYNGQFSAENTKKMLLKHYSNTKWVLEDINIAIQNCQDFSDSIPAYSRGTCDYAWVLATCLNENLKAAKL
uniref:Uncharacterized protein n=1 Tax=Clastoptera arizonana TaxID=38151 RepID=A0A1B6CB65_9HEMI